MVAMRPSTAGAVRKTKKSAGTGALDEIGDEPPGRDDSLTLTTSGLCAAGSSLALLSKLQGSSCLTHVGREGPAQ